jgi:hypothetical protein
MPDEGSNFESSRCQVTFISDLVLKFLEQFLALRIDINNCNKLQLI